MRLASQFLANMPVNIPQWAIIRFCMVSRRVSHLSRATTSGLSGIDDMSDSRRAAFSAASSSVRLNELTGINEELLPPGPVTSRTVNPFLNMVLTSAPCDLIEETISSVKPFVFTAQKYQKEPTFPIFDRESVKNNCCVGIYGTDNVWARLSCVHHSMQESCIFVV